MHDRLSQGVDLLCSSSFPFLTTSFVTPFVNAITGPP